MQELMKSKPTQDIKSQPMPQMIHPWHYNILNKLLFQNLSPSKFLVCKYCTEVRIQHC